MTIIHILNNKNTRPNPEQLNFWFYSIGVNIIPFNSLNKKPLINWKECRDVLFPIKVYEKWKQDCLFEKNCAAITGKIGEILSIYRIKVIKAHE